MTNWPSGVEFTNHNAQTARVEARTDEGMCGEADERER
jgi:hypothetical protein